MQAYIFPGQGAQFSGMGSELSNRPEASAIFKEADEIIGFNLSQIMFSGSEDELKQTKVTQPAIFVHSIAIIACLGQEFKPEMVAGHSLGEFSALVAAGALTFTEAFKLVILRASAMQQACEQNPSTMAAILGLDDAVIEEICKSIPGIVVPANYNSPGQLVISGSLESIAIACERLKAAGAKRALPLNVGGAFHSPLMEPARQELQEAILKTVFLEPVCPIYQNVDAAPHVNSDEIRQNLINQLTAPVLWSQTIRAMIRDGATTFTEAGPGKVLQGLVKKIDANAVVASA